MIKDETLFYKKKISQIQQELEASPVDSENNKNSVTSKDFLDKIFGMLQEDAKPQVLTM
jgi:hypothetical protein